MTEALTVDVVDSAGKKTGSVELPAEVFDAPLNIPLMHQVVVGQLADDHLVHERNVEGGVEDLGGQLDAAGLLARGVDDVDGECLSHGLRLPSRRCGRRRPSPWGRGSRR